MSHLASIHAVLAVLAALAAPSAAQTTLTLAPTQDTYVQDIFPAVNFGTSETLLIGRGSFFGLGLIRTLVQFDLAALPHANVRRATFCAYEFDTEPAAGGMSCPLFRCTSAWSETASTWNLQPAFDLTKTWASADVGDGPLGFIDWDVSKLVLEQAAGNLPNLGWLIRAGSETAGISRLGYFRSREFLADPAQLPRLVVELYDLDLTIGPLTPGVPAPALVERADAGSLVYAFIDLSGPGATPIVPLGIVLELHDPQPLLPMVADATGSATFLLRVPAAASGIPFRVQAAAVGKLSNRRDLVVP
jgi:hypothetical protein